MRIAIDARMIQPQPTGIGRVTINLMESMARLNPAYEYTAMSLEGAVPQLSGFPNIKHQKAPFGHLSLRTHTSLPRMIKESGADLTHYLYFVTPLYSQVPSVVTIHDTIYSHFPNQLPPHRRLLYGFFMKRSMKSARRIICVSEASARDLKRFFPNESESKVRVVHNGVEDRFRPSDVPDKSEARSTLGLPDPYILYVGNHRGHKNLKRLIEAFSQIADDVPHFLVLPEARGKGSEITMSAIEQYGVSDRIVFHPMPDEDLPLIYGLADAFVFPSLSEGFGLPPLEAMACGTPVITSNISSLPEVVGEAGILVDPYNVEEIAQAIRKVLTDNELRLSMSEKGMERAKLFTWENTARKTLVVYEEAINIKPN